LKEEEEEEEEEEEQIGINHTQKGIGRLRTNNRMGGGGGKARNTLIECSCSFNIGYILHPASEQLPLPSQQCESQVGTEELFSI
jgi:hypothetical protein